MIKALSYVGFTSPDATSWTAFGPDVLGVEAHAADGIVRLRLDDAAWRVEVSQGPSNSLAFIGWDTGSDADLADAAERLRNSGIEVHTGDADLLNARAVRGLAWFVDPFGFRHELVCGQKAGDRPFRSPKGVSGFVTGANGLGHLVLLIPDLQFATRFFVDLLGFRHSDDIDLGFNVRFLHCNPRHHSLALTEVPGMRGVHHLMLEVRDIDDVGRAYDRAKDAGHPITMSLGRHTNDQMTSFYVRSPSGFDIEFGCGGLQIDMDQEWPVGHYDAMSYWGHRRPAVPLPPGILQSSRSSAR